MLGENIKTWKKYSLPFFVNLGLVKKCPVKQTKMKNKPTFDDMPFIQKSFFSFACLFFIMKQGMKTEEVTKLSFYIRFRDHKIAFKKVIQIVSKEVLRI